jgi:hypothetical protein
MSNKKRTKQYEQEWDAAIAEAEIQLKKWRSKAVRLMVALQTFREAKKMGKPWPGNSERHRHDLHSEKSGVALRHGKASPQKYTQASGRSESDSSQEKAD